MDVFSLREAIVADYERFTGSFTQPAAPDIKAFLKREYGAGRFWPPPLIQLNPSFVPGRAIEELVGEGLLDPECARIFRAGKADGGPGKELRLHLHQEEAIRIAASGRSYVLTTGTGSGKSLSYFIPIVDWVLKQRRADPRRGPGIAAIVVYPMNALCNSQLDELEKFLHAGYPKDGAPVTFARYTGQEKQEVRDEIARKPPDILLTNYMMLELILTRQHDVDKAVVRAARGLRFLVLDELHTYRGRQGADVALLVRRVREALNERLIAVGTSATMASEGGAADRRRAAVAVATRLFGTTVADDDIVTETLTRMTPDDVDIGTAALAAAIDAGIPEQPTFAALRRHPIAVWIEMRLGLDREDDKWIRTRAPKSLREAAELLAENSGRQAETCEAYLKRFLLLTHATRDAAGRSLFAFRLHQFIAGAGDLFGTLEPEGVRYLTLNGQQFQPGAGRQKRLFSYCFCRECGQEYVPVWATDSADKDEQLAPRDLGDRMADDEDARFGFFMPDRGGKFLPAPIEEAFPEEWLFFDRGEAKLKPHYRKLRPRAVTVDALGEPDPNGLPGWLIPGSFRFCLNPDCRAYYDASIRSDLTKLARLSTEGRSSATTVLTLSTLRHLLGEARDLPPHAKKLLGFTDNRQDASLQAGHFNDFIQILLLRGALLAAIESAPEQRLKDETLTQRVFEQLRLEPIEFAASPDAKGIAAENSRKALRDVLGYRLYFDLRRGWRVTNPNLEQLGLLSIAYLSLDDACADPELWQPGPDALALAPPAIRRQIAELVLDAMRRQLCVKTRYLDRFEQEQIGNRSHNLLKEPWGLSEDERLLDAAIFLPISEPASWKGEYRAAFASLRSRLGRQLGRAGLWGGADQPCYPGKLTQESFQAIVEHLLAALERYGIVERVEVAKLGLGWRVNADALQWQMGGGQPKPGSGLRVTDNAFFRALYRNVAAALAAGDHLLHRMEAREHTAQVDATIREEREDRFRAATLPVLFCSPTMELGVDIAELNTVYMRNLPPTPANYAQRSGRAGRSGQPALVLSYAAAKSPHDQYFFKTPIRMVAGAVNPPALDLANEDLISSHLHAVWLAETGKDLGRSVDQSLDLAKADELPLSDEIKAAIDRDAVRTRTLERGRRILAMLKGYLDPALAPWFTEDWLERTVNGAALQFDRAFQRWRTLFTATRQQMKRAQEVINSPASIPREREEAKRRHDEAFQQQKLLLDTQSAMNSDFYVYRYLASQGFLPGYNFPRLPLLAYVPARREKVARDSFLSRPRFLALSEFGPRSVIYHEGSQYRVTRAMLTIRDEHSITVEAKLPVTSCRRCPNCGYGHFGEDAEHERCLACDTLLEGGLHLRTLYRIDNVATRRVMRITSDEEERLRLGYETITTLQFARRNGALQVLRSLVGDGEGELLELQYGPAATVWRVNLGWRRRREPSIHGFNIDVVTGRWAKDAQAPEDAGDDGDNDGKMVTQRIVPYVEDRRNLLIVVPREPLDIAGMATLQYALKRGIEREFQLEESELVAEPLPDADNRRAILFYEAAEGGAGVLTRLAADHEALRRVAIRALESCHYRPQGEEWRFEGIENADQECEAGCYKCLLSYYNQPEHDRIDRRSEQVLRLLCRLTRSEPRTGSEGRSYEEQLGELWRLSGSSLERAWLTMVKDGAYRLPDRAQRLLEEHGTRPDFEYTDAQALIYIDGPHHEHDARKALDQKITERLEDAGYTVIRFGTDQAGWPTVFGRFPDVFGKGDGG